MGVFVCSESRFKRQKSSGRPDSCQKMVPGVSPLRIYVVPSRKGTKKDIKCVTLSVQVVSSRKAAKMVQYLSATASS